MNTFWRNKKTNSPPSISNVRILISLSNDSIFYYNLVINFVIKMTIYIQKTYFICYILYSYKHPLFSIISVNCFQKNIYEYNYMVLAFILRLENKLNYLFSWNLKSSNILCIAFLSKNHILSDIGKRHNIIFMKHTYQLQYLRLCKNALKQRHLL